MSADRGPATPGGVPAAPAMLVVAPDESPYPDWRERLGRNLSRRSAGRWEPLTHPTRRPEPE